MIVVSARNLKPEPKGNIGLILKNYCPKPESISAIPVFLYSHLTSSITTTYAFNSSNFVGNKNSVRTLKNKIQPAAICKKVSECHQKKYKNFTMKPQILCNLTNTMLIIS